MKFNHFYKKITFNFVCLIFILLLSKIANANINDDIKKITSKLRCMTCQNQTIYSSEADFSLTIKQIVRDKLKNKETEKEIIDFLIKRYDIRYHSTTLFKQKATLYTLHKSVGFMKYNIHQGVKRCIILSRTNIQVL